MDASSPAATELRPTAVCVASPRRPATDGTCAATNGDALDEALSKIGLDRCTLTIDPASARTGLMDPTDPRRAAGSSTLHEHPLRLPAYGEQLAADFDDAIASDTPVTRAIAAASFARGKRIETCLDPGWFAFDANDEAPFATAITDGEVSLGRAATTLDRGAVAQIPLDLQRALVPVLRAIADGDAKVRDARKAPMSTLKELYAIPSWVMGSYRLTLDEPLLTALDAVDLHAMAEAAAKIAIAIESAKLVRFAGREVPSVDVATSFGNILIRGSGTDTYGAGAGEAAFVLDTGGDDIYEAPVASASLHHAVSIAVDLGGSDRYAYEEKAAEGDGIGHRLPSDGFGRAAGRTLSRVMRQGGAVLGVAMLFDLGDGNDTYVSQTISQGAAALGVGVLYDQGGDDTYSAEAFSQGAAAWGIGILFDRAGSDHFTLYSMGQGFGFTQGLGAIVDGAGNDVYVADAGDPALGGDPLYPTSQLPGASNASMAQGCGVGFRPDASNSGLQFAGGMGLLRDASGNDRYTASVFGQGAAFAMGVGIFMEGGGNDAYEGLWYVQGAGAHAAVALFRDRGGDDTYNAKFPIAASSIGVGHDFSVGVHYDEGGNDSYRAPTLSLGSGNANGIGIMLNIGGTDSFAAADASAFGAALLGGASAPRDRIPTVGVFVKAGGLGTYTAAGKTVNRAGKTWRATDEDHDERELGVGLDRPMGTASLP